MSYLLGYSPALESATAPWYVLRCHPTESIPEPLGQHSNPLPASGRRSRAAAAACLQAEGTNAASTALDRAGRNKQIWNMQNLLRAAELGQERRQHGRS